jgi:hypothetical protein
MRTLLKEIENKFIEVNNSEYCDSCDRTKDTDGTCNCKPVEEANVTGAIAGYSTPNAFAKTINKKTAEQLGYKLVQEAMDAKYERLIEGYRDYAKTGNKKPSRHINDSIKEIAKKLQEIEEVVGHTTRFKNEAGVASSQYGPAASKALAKIAHRLTKISERVRALGE